MTNNATQTSIKKPAIDNELSTPEARASRLRRVRNLANLSRQEICSFDDININTYKGWELARFGGLSADGAEKIVKRVAVSGVICSVDWLLYGTQPHPTLTIDVSSCSERSTKKSNVSSIIDEFSVYKVNRINAVLSEVIDDGLSPQYQIGDFVAGEKRFDDEISTTISQICIVETTDGRKLIRYIKAGDIKGKYSLCCTNYQTTTDIILNNISLIYSAPISRHYKISENSVNDTPYKDPF